MTGNRAAAFESIEQAKIYNAKWSTSRNFLGKIKAYEAIVQAQLAAGDIEGARQTCNQAKKDVITSTRDFKGKADKVEAYCTIAECQIAAGDINNARDSLKKANVALMSVSTDKVSAYHTITAVQIQLSNFDEAKAILAKTRLQSGGLHRRIAEAQVKSGNLVELLEWIKSVDYNYDCAYAYLGAAEGLIEKEKH